MAWGLDRLAPESAPAARGAVHVQFRVCADCRGGSVDTHTTHESNACAQHPADARCSDTLAYFESLRLRQSFAERARISPDNPLITGERLARQYHCFQCHGYLGQGGFENARSLKGYVPGYFGADFKALTRNANPESVRAWIMFGMDPEIARQPITGPIARFFFRRQAISMPSYRSLQPGEIDVLVNYVIELNSWGPMTAESLRAYGDLSRTR